MSEYRNMTRLACFVASQYVSEYDRDTVESLVEEGGWEAAEDFTTWLAEYTVLMLTKS